MSEKKKKNVTYVDINDYKEETPLANIIFRDFSDYR